MSIPHSRFSIPRASLPSVLLALLFALLSCVPGARAPEVAATRTLELPGAPPPALAPGEFGVVFAAPRGETREASEVTLVFNRPMHALEVAGAESAPPAKIVVEGTSMAPRGAWRWMGTSALVFAPDPALPKATAYVVTVAAGTRALSGDSLGKAFEMRFSTPRPSVERVDPSEGSDHLVPSQTFEVRFDQPVDLAEVERATTLSVGDDKDARRIVLHASRPQKDNDKLAKLVPASPLPLGSRITIAVDGSLRGTQGPLPMRAPKTASMRTYGPLAVRKIDCSRAGATLCHPLGAFDVQLSNRVAYADLKAHVRVSPGVPVKWAPLSSDDSKSTWFSIPARVRPGTGYRVTVTAGLRDEYGQALARDVVVPLETGDLDPQVVVGLSGTVIEAQSSRARVVPVTSMNVAQYSLATGALDESGVAEVLTGGAREYESTQQLFDRVAKMPGIKVESVSPGARRNASGVRNVPIDPMLSGRGGRGAVVVATTWGVHLASVTDLAITAKMSRFGSAVWVTRLSSGKPVPDATVSILDRSGVVFDARTGADGVAAIPADKYAPAGEDGRIDRKRLVVARTGDDWTWRRVGDVFGWGGGGAWIDVSGGLDPIGMLFTDRGVYRPGETVKLQAIFRLPTPRGTDTPAGREIALRATDSEGNAYFERDVKLDDFGAATVDVPVPATARLGEGVVQATLVEPGKPRDERARAASTTVQLAAYKAAEFKVGVEPGARSFTRGDEARFDVHGDYLFGAPMAGAKVRWNATRAAAWFSPPGADDFAVDDGAFQRDLPDATPRAARFQSGEAALDAHGVLALRVPVALAGQRGAESVTIEAEVEDVSRQTVAGSAGAIVHPGSFYVALKWPKDLFVSSGSTVRAEVTAIEPGGRRRAGAAVHVDLVRRTWSNVMESSGESGAHWNSRAVDATVAACDVTTAADVVPCALAIPQPGYYLVHATARDEKQRDVAASYELYAIGEGGDAGWRMDDSAELPLVTDKKTYQVGDTARVLVKSPFREADALIGVERSGIYREERVHLSGAAPTITVPVTDEMRPNAFVAVHLVRGRTKAAPGKGGDVGAPAYRSGHAQIVVDPESRRLKVAVATAKKDMRPGETVEADVAVVDRAGRAVSSELTLWAVDEGVLMLTRYQTPDPIPTFTAPRPLAVFTMESRADLARIFRVSLGEPGVDKGDEGGGGGEAMRADFRATAWFEGGVKTGDDGRAHVRFKLPDNLTTFRLMAVAIAHDDRFGAGEAQITTSRPLMLRPALPRFLRAGDSIEAGVVVTTKGIGATRVEVTAAAEGATLAGDAKRVVDVPANASVEVRWPFAAPAVGKAKLAFRARASGGETDGVELVKAVQAPTEFETVALYGETKEAAGEKLGDLSSVRADVGQLDVRVASTALVGLDDGVNQLLEYPYGCTEQLTSRLVPLVPLRRLATDFGIKLSADADRWADEAIAKILANQHGDGGFGWWPDSRTEDAWVTAYALWGLDVAKKGGRLVPDDAIDRAASWLRAHLKIDRERDALGLATSAFVLDVLAEVGKPDPGFENRLYERRTELPLFARALLAHAMARSSMETWQARELLRDLDSHLRVTPAGATVVENLGDEYAPLLDSEARTSAMVLRALLAIEPKHALAPRVARGILAMREHGKWRSTQEAAWSLLALDDYRRVAEAEAPDFDARVWVANQEVLAAPMRGRSPTPSGATVPVRQLLASPQSTVAFQVDGRGQLFYEARLEYARREVPRDEIDRGFYVRKVVRAVAPDGLQAALATLPDQSQSRVRAGDLVLVDLVVVTPAPREQVAVDDPLPAGLEAVDSSLATTARSLDVTDAGGQGDERDAEESDDDAAASGRAWRFAWYHREIHDDRVLTFVEHMPAGMYHYRYLARATTPGTFVVPPTKAECMYAPEVFGRNAGASLQVSAP